METVSAASPASIKRLILGVCIVAGASMSVTATFNYILTPMLNDFGVSSADAGLALTIPSIAAILVVFIAGLLGDRLGHRRVLVVACGLFLVGCLIVAVSNGQTLLSAGLLLEGVGATTMSVTSLGLLGAKIEDDKERASAFATYGLVSPIVYLVLPVMTGLIVANMSWRTVALIWMIVGLIAAVASLTLMPKTKPGARSGELWTPILAGFLVAAAVQTISHISDTGLFSPRVLFSALGFLIILAVLVFTYRRVSSPSLSIKPLKSGATSILLIIVLLVPFANTWYYTTLAFQYLFGLSVLQTALAMIPAQICGIIGAKVVAGTLMRKVGVHRAGTILLALLTVGIFSTVLVQADSPVWILMACVSLFSIASIGTGVVLTNAVMSTAPHSESGNTSAYRSAASSIGVAVGFIIMGSVVFGTVNASVVSGFEAEGLSSQQAQAQVEQMQSDSQQPDFISQYSYPMETGETPVDIVKQSIVDGLHANAILGAAVAAVCTGIFAFYRRRLPGDSKEPKAESARS